jgi:hypothetical protein
MEELYTFVGEGWEQEDDITLLTLKRSASLTRIIHEAATSAVVRASHRCWPGCPEAR